MAVGSALKDWGLESRQHEGLALADVMPRAQLATLRGAFEQIARGLGKRTVAERVDGEDTLALLCEYGVELAQGYRLSEPGPIEESRFAPGLERAPSRTSPRN